MNCFIETDLRQAEWVVTAYCCGDPRMIDVVERRLDAHLRTGSMISGAPEGLVQLEDRLVGHITDPSALREARRKGIPPQFEGISTANVFFPNNMSIRQAGKKSNHGLNYGMEYRRFALENGILETDAQHIVRIYRDIAYPGLRSWYTEIQEELKRTRQLTNCFGQSRKFMDQWGVSLFMEAYAFLPQSTVGNVTNRGMQYIYEKGGKKIDLSAQVHDSILTHHRFDSWEELAEQLAFCDRAMTEICCYRERTFILDREFKVGVNWGGEVMQKVTLEDGNGSRNAENLRLAYQASCEKAKAA